MALRPKAFSIPSSTQLKVTFTENLATDLTTDNFVIESLNGAVNDLEVTGLEVDGAVALVKTRPQVAGNYYLLKLVDTSSVVFTSSRGERLVDDSVSRELFFVGIDNVNPIRDRIFEKVPGMFSLENSALKNILSAQAEELYTAQKKVGQLLSDNYISIQVDDEFRVRGSGATDRFTNEQAYEVIRVSKNPTGTAPQALTLDYTADNSYSRLQKLPYYPVSLQQKIISDEIINSSSEGNSFNGYLITVASSNIIKLLSLTLIKSSDTADCDGNLGTEYNIERYKYTLSENYYDQDCAFEYSGLKANQFLLSEFGNIDKPEPGDTIILSYLTKDTSRAVIDGTVSVSRVESQSYESVPTNTTRFYLDKAPIVNSNNEIPVKGGVTFAESENISTTPYEFRREVPYNISKLPSKPGEYSVNYETGEVFVVGDDTRQGTGRNNYVVSYLYRREFVEDLDFSISGYDLVANPDRLLSGNEAEVFLNYESVYARDVDYAFKSHIEVLGEQVENRISQSFAIETKNSPITNVYRVYNQTTGEVYNPLYHTNTEIFFSGNRSPEVKSVESEVARFRKVTNDKLEIVGEFIVPVFEVQITSNASKNAIQFSPSIPAELLAINSTDYFIREVSGDTEEPEVEDIQIRFFGDPDGNNLVSSLAISATASTPSNGAKVLIGTRGYIIALEESGVLNKNLDALGFHANTSLSFSNNTVFANEKFFEPITSTAGFNTTTSGDISVSLAFGSEEILYDNLSRLRKVGDYCIDYYRGVAYVAISADQDLNIGTADYYTRKHQSIHPNVLTVLGVSKKAAGPDGIEDALIVYNNLDHDNESVSVLDIEHGYVTFDGITDAADADGELQLVCEVLEDYTTVVPYYIQNLKGVWKYTDFVGANLNATAQADRQAERSVTSLHIPASKGGFNLNDGTSISFNKNVIDLKKSIRRRVYSSGDNFVITVRDPLIQEFYEARRVSRGTDTFFDSSLNITKISGVKVVGSTLGSGTATVAVISNSFSDIDTDNDYLLDASGNRFRITAVDSFRSEITVISPAENNALADEPDLDPEGSDSKIVVKPTVTISDGVMTITIPGDAGTFSGELLEIIYITSLTPEIGTPLVVDYRFGNIYFDYNYVYDQIAVWYEYGDNELDWSISSTLEEGDEYFVTYRYGASRSALRTNFGTLTQVPFFEQFPLEVDRELYRSGVKGVLQAFPKGPTIPAFEGLVSSFTDIAPEITEINFGSWILGRDHTYPTTIEAEGNLTFTDGRFNSGLLIDDQTTVYIPSISNISLREGTLETWIRPDWSGINNDASLTFCFNGIGREKYVLSANSNPFEQGWVMAPVEDIGGIVDTKGLGNRISNFKTVDGLAQYDSFNNGLYRSFKFLNRVTRIDTDSKIRVPIFGTHINQISTSPALSSAANYVVGQKLVTDTHIANGLTLELSLMSDSNGALTFITTSEDVAVEEIPDFIRPHRTRSCKCAINNRVRVLETFSSMTMTVDLNEVVDLAIFKDANTIVQDTPRAMVLIDSAGDIYQVVGLVSGDAQIYETSIPSTVSSVIVDRFPINNQQIKQASVLDINALVPTGTVSLYYKNVKIMGSGASNNAIAFNHQSSFVLDWSDYHNYRIDRNPLTNIVDYYIDNHKYKGFYTDGILVSENPIKFSHPAAENRGVYIGTFDNSILSTLEVFSSLGLFFNRFNLSDIYIGRNGYNPGRMPFTVNRDDSPKVAVGLPNNITTDEGIFIGFDEMCTSPLSDDIGQWVMRTRAARVYLLPVDVTVHGLDNYTNLTERVSVDHCFSGYVLTDGEFSSVVRSTRDEVNGQCTDGVVCDATFRYCGNELLEEYGWRKIEESDSGVVNTIIGGRETLYGDWRKEGSFTTISSEGIYRAGPSLSTGADLENIIFTRLPCSGGNTEYTVSTRVVSYDANISGSSIGRFTGAVNGNLIGYTPVHISDSYFDYKVSFALDDLGDGLIVVIDNSTGSFVDIARYNWNDNSFHEIRTMVDYSEEQISLYVDNLLISRTLFSDYGAAPLTLNEEALAIHVFDGELIDSKIFHDTFEGNVVDIDLVFFSGFYQDGDGYLESSDIFIHTDDRIDFEFCIDALDGYFQDTIGIVPGEDIFLPDTVITGTPDGYDGYSTISGTPGYTIPGGVIDGYDGYDGYQIELDYIGVDEIFISSDKLRYIVDTGLAEAEQRLSLFKDGKGFLNFRIFDNSLTERGEAGMFNIATNIKNFRAGEAHHVAISWKLNSINEQDEMHLFIDGQEVPNLYRFGGKVPVRLNEKYSDVSKEILQNFLVRDIIYPESYTDGTVTATTSLFQSDSVVFTEEMLGRSLIVHDAPLATDLIGRELIIKGVTNGAAILGTGDELTTVEFTTSDSNITFSFPPNTSGVLTDLRNTRFFIFRTNSAEEESEMGGVLYQVVNGEVDIISGQNVINPKYRINVDTRLIEFVGRNEDCNYVATIDESDIDIHIKTFGLNLEICREKLNLSGSSYETGEVKFSGQSVLNLHSKEPVNLKDVEIRRIILDRTAVDIISPVMTMGGGYIADFSIELDPSISKVSSAEGRIYKQNLGRYLTLIIDSDNIDFCEFDGYEDAYQDGYQDGYLDGAVNTITIYGATIDGTNEETFFVDKNGRINGAKLFTRVDRVEGTLKIIDPNYFELGVISIEERDLLSVVNNGGSSMEVFDYRSGHFVLTTAGSNGTHPFELHAGYYHIEYPTFLTVNIREVGHDLFIGTDFNKKNHFGGSIDEFRIISESSLDTRITEAETSGTRSVTDDYFRSSEFCPDEQTLALIHFNNPIEYQKRRLRNKEFLDENSNFKYKLTRAQQENLILSANNEEDFVRKMINYGFKYDDAYKTYVEVHFAEGGPLWNEADFYKNYLDYVLGTKSVNSSFGNSAFFIPGSYLLIENDQGYFRKDEGTIEFWVSPILDTIVDDEIRYYLDISSSRRTRLKSKSSTVIELPNPASEIISIKLLTKKSKDSGLYTTTEEDRIIFDEISRSEISGKLEGGTGVQKDFSVGHKLSADGSKIFLAEPLPGAKVDVVVSYIPLGSQGDRISVLKNQYSQLVFAITANGVDNVIASDINWKKNTWHRIKLTYRTNSNGDDFIRIFVDGRDGGYIRYGTGLIYGTGYVYGQYIFEEGAPKAIDYRIPLKDDLRLIAVGSDIYGDHSAYGRMDNIRFSRIIRNDARDVNGVLVDANYSDNTNTVRPVVKDDATTMLLDFNASGEKVDNFTTVIDPKNGVFNFKIDVIDNFDKVIGINDGLIEDLIVELVDTLKPAHTNAYVKFKKSNC